MSDHGQATTPKSPGFNTPDMMAFTGKIPFKQGE